MSLTASPLSPHEFLMIFTCGSCSQGTHTVCHSHHPLLQLTKPFSNWGDELTPHPNINIHSPIIEYAPFRRFGIVTISVSIGCEPLYIIPDELQEIVTWACRKYWMGYAGTARTLGATNELWGLGSRMLISWLSQQMLSRPALCQNEVPVLNTQSWTWKV